MGFPGRPLKREAAKQFISDHLSGAVACCPLFLLVDVGEGSTCNSKENGCFDGFENVNVYKTHPDVVANLSTQIHAIVAQRRPNPGGGGRMRRR